MLLVLSLYLCLFLFCFFVLFFCFCAVVSSPFCAASMRLDDGGALEQTLARDPELNAKGTHSDSEDSKKRGGATRRIKPI